MISALDGPRLTAGPQLSARLSNWRFEKAANTYATGAAKSTRLVAYIVMALKEKVV